MFIKCFYYGYVADFKKICAILKTYFERFWTGNKEENRDEQHRHLFTNGKRF